MPIIEDINDQSVLMDFTSMFKNKLKIKKKKSKSEPKIEKVVEENIEISDNDDPKVLEINSRLSKDSENNSEIHYLTSDEDTDEDTLSMRSTAKKIKRILYKLKCNSCNCTPKNNN